MIQSQRITLRKLKIQDATEVYLNWLNDSEIQKFTRRHNIKTSMADLQQFIENTKNSDDIYLAIEITNGNKHIGNVFLINIDDNSKNAELTIMIGDQESQGQGYATETIELVTKYAFETLGLHRLYAYSPNPSFNKVMKKIGWHFEGTQQEAFWDGEKFIDNESWAILNNKKNQ